MVHWLRALTPLRENLWPIPNAHMVDSQLSITPVCGHPSQSSGLHRPCIHMVQVYMQAKHLFAWIFEKLNLLKEN